MVSWWSWWLRGHRGATVRTPIVVELCKAGRKVIGDDKRRLKLGYSSSGCIGLYTLATEYIWCHAIHDKLDWFLLPTGGSRRQGTCAWAVIKIGDKRKCMDAVLSNLLCSHMSSILDIEPANMWAVLLSESDHGNSAVDTESCSDWSSVLVRAMLPEVAVLL